MQKYIDVVHRYLPESIRSRSHVGRIFIQDIVRCDLTKQASAMAYVTLLSLVPSLVAIFCVLSLFTPLLGKGSSLIDQAREFILENLASDSGEAAVSYLDRMISKISLATIGWSSFASVLVTLILLLRQVEEALNRIWLVRKGRNVFIRFMYFWTFLTLGMVIVAIGVGVTASLSFPALFSSTSSVSIGPMAWIIGRFTELLGSFIFFFFLYKIGPNCAVGTKNAALGALVAGTALQISGWLYGIYVRDAKNYQTLYGALAQVPIFLVWLYIGWIIILIGALVSWRLQEGFPVQGEEEALDQSKSPVEQLRNMQFKAALPWVSLLAIHQQFAAGSGKGLSGQDLAHKMRLPASWVTEALDALQSLGYVVAGKTQGSVSSGAPQVTDPYFPTAPATNLKVTQVTQDLSSPMEQWLENWHYDMPINLRKAIHLIGRDHGAATMSDILQAI
ncbi:MAG: YihY family inner membrane protein [Deltaproteobacteria bacterium]|nr:YihY family inner membrane protein [Deltaproteobacteria bacterium]